MTSDRTIVDLIEQANDTRPYCGCGRNTTVVVRDGQAWLECASLAEPPPENRLRRLVDAVISLAHARQPIVELPLAA